MVLCFFGDTMYTGVPVYVSILNYAKCAHFSTSEIILLVLCGYTLDTCTVYKLDKKEHIVHTQSQDMHDRTQSICSIILHVYITDMHMTSYTKYRQHNIQKEDTICH
jgi:hypothetical protein